MSHEEEVKSTDKQQSDKDFFRQNDETNYKAQL